MRINGVGKVHRINKVRNDFKDKQGKGFQEELRKAIKNRNKDSFEFSNVLNKKKEDEDLEK